MVDSFPLHLDNPSGDERGSQEAAPEISGISVVIGIMVPLGVLVVIFGLLGHMTELEKMRQSTR